MAIVICTRNRAPLLRQTLESLEAQTCAAGTFEVIVIDDGSTDGTREVVEHAFEKLPIRYIRQRHAGLGSAKNHGLWSTVADLILFLDDDDLADPTLIDEHIATHRRWPALHDAVLGHTRLAPQLCDDPFMRFVTEIGCYLFAYGSITHGDLLDYSYFWGGRTSCKRSFLIQHGTFDPRFRFGCEDIELGFRLSRHGLRVIYNRFAVSTMIRGISLDDFCERLRRQGQSNAVFGLLHEDAGVRAWTRIDEARAREIALEARHDAIIGAARHLDAMLRRKIALGLAVESSELECTHRAYRAACETSLLEGISEGLDSSAQVDRPVTSR